MNMARLFLALKLAAAVALWGSPGTAGSPGPLSSRPAGLPGRRLASSSPRAIPGSGRCSR